MASIFVRALAALGFADIPPQSAQAGSRPHEPAEPLPPVDSLAAVADVPARGDRPLDRQSVAPPPRVPPNGGSLRMVRATPTSMDDAKLVADRLRRGMPVAMNLEDVEEPMARRIVDFVSGATFALNGTVRKIGRAVFLCSPGGLPVEELASQQRVPGHLFESVEGSAEGSRPWTA